MPGPAVPFFWIMSAPFRGTPFRSPDAATTCIPGGRFDLTLNVWPVHAAFGVGLQKENGLAGGTGYTWPTTAGGTIFGTRTVDAAAARWLVAELATEATSKKQAVTPKVSATRCLIPRTV